MKVCSKCEIMKPVEDFGKDSSTGDDLRCYCKSCGKQYWKNYNSKKRIERNARARELRAKNPQVSRENNRRCHFKKSYGITLEQLEQMRANQNNQCLICSKFFNLGWGKQGPSVDHSHSSGKVRGLLCHSCNTALGKFQDSIPMLQKAVEYLQKNS